MPEITHSIGIDISTQTITATLLGVVEADGSPREILISDRTASRPCVAEPDRKSPGVWLQLVRECVADLKDLAPEAELARGMGISTTFPGVFAIGHDGTVDPGLVSLYDNTDDCGVCSGQFDELLARAESETLSRMWPGNMAIGLVSLLKSRCLRLEDLSALAPPNTAFANELLRAVGQPAEPGGLFSDFTETLIGGLYDSRTAEPLPPGVIELIKAALPGLEIERLRRLLPRAEPSWRNVVPDSALPAVRDLLGMSHLESVSIGAGDSPLATLALLPDEDTVLNVRGSSDSPLIVVDAPRSRTGPRETVLHYPLPTVTSAVDSPWCVVAPTLRSGRVWDWVRRLRYPDGDPNGDSELEELASAALDRRAQYPEVEPLVFDTALGGERSPDWDSHATGTISGLVESHDLGDIALAALKGTSKRLRRAIESMESRYDVHPSRLLMAGGPTRNRLWNHITEQVTGKRTYLTSFTNASLLGAAMLGYATSFDGNEPDAVISRRLLSLSSLAARHTRHLEPVPGPQPV